MARSLFSRKGHMYRMALRRFRSHPSLKNGTKLDLARREFARERLWKFWKRNFG